MQIQIFSHLYFSSGWLIKLGVEKDVLRGMER